MNWQICGLLNPRSGILQNRFIRSVFCPLNRVGIHIRGSLQIEEEGVLELLRQLHPKPSLGISINSGDSRGLWACLRAYNDKYAEIVFRIHAEFTLKDGRFTPSQFAGHLVIDRIKEKVASFKMYVPEGVLNFDVGRDSTRTIDVGFCPRMELRAEIQETPPNIKFVESIFVPSEIAERKVFTAKSTNRSTSTGYLWKRSWKWHRHKGSRFMFSQ